MAKGAERNKRILVLGATGVNKSTVIKNICNASPTYNPTVYDFEKDFIFIKGLLGESPNDYLDAKPISQRDIWLKGWNRCIKAINKTNGDIILLMHGVLTRPAYSTRSPICLEKLMEFAPTGVINLIDDIYSMWYNTEQRSKGMNHVGRPTPEQLLAARRSEIFLGDIIANYREDVQPPHYILAVRHPAIIGHRLLFEADKHRKVYLSFPISGPRAKLAKNDRSGIEEINEFLRTAHSFQNNVDNNVVFFCPLTIDELPLQKAFKAAAAAKQKEVVFDIKDRWNVKDFYARTTLMAGEGIPMGQEISIPCNAVEECHGLILNDVSTRDYRLIIQSDCLAVYNPVFDGQVSNGVLREIQFAMFNRIPVFIYQNPKHDPDNKAYELSGYPGKESDTVFSAQTGGGQFLNFISNSANTIDLAIKH